MKKFLCKILGHRPGRVDVGNRLSRCTRCEAKLRVSYDMAYGETVVEHVIPEDSK